MDDSCRFKRFRWLIGAIMLIGLAFALGPRADSADAEVAKVRLISQGAVLCAAGYAMVTARTAADQRAACVGTTLALSFLEARGLSPRAAVQIAMVDSLEPVGGAALLGLYDPRTKQIEVLAHSAFSTGISDEGAFGLPMDFEMQAGVVAHEVTHAILDQYADDYPLDRASHEYLAYVVQLSVLSSETRARILRRIDVSGFDALSQASPLYLAFDPGRFGVNAYLHYRNEANQAAVLAKLVRKSKAEAGMWE